MRRIWHPARGFLVFVTLVCAFTAQATQSQVASPGDSDGGSAPPPSVALTNSSSNLVEAPSQLPELQTTPAPPSDEYSIPSSEGASDADTSPQPASNFQTSLSGTANNIYDAGLVAEPGSSQTTALIITTITLLVLVLALSGVLIWGYLRQNRLRKLVDAQGEHLGDAYVAIVPSRWESQELKNSETLNSLNRQIENLVRHTGVLTGNISDMQKAYSLLQNELTEKDNEIRRFKEGYDDQILNRFFGLFLETKDYVSHVISENQINEKYVRNIDSFLQQALDQGGIEIFTPMIGDPYSTEQHQDRPETIVSQEPSQDRTVASVEQHGYRARNGVVVRKATVKVFIFKKESN